MKFKIGDKVKSKVDIAIPYSKEFYCRVGDVLIIESVGNRESVNYNWDYWTTREENHGLRRFGMNSYEVEGGTL
jgi:hypothetical protein